MKAVQVSRFGGPEVLEAVELEPAAGARRATSLIDVDAAGRQLRRHPRHRRHLPGAAAPAVRAGRRGGGRARSGGTRRRGVVALLAAGGGYAEQALAPQDAVVPDPDGVTDGAALALVLQGTTAWHLLRTSTRLGPGESVVVHAAAGGVGTHRRPAGPAVGRRAGDRDRVLPGEAGARAVARRARRGRRVVGRDADEVRDLLREANGGRDVDVVLEMTGGHVFDGSLAALAPLGRLAVYGLASRTAPRRSPPVALMATSRTVAGFWLVHAMTAPGGSARRWTSCCRWCAPAGCARGGRHLPAGGGAARARGAARPEPTGKLVLQVAAPGR